MKRLLSYISIPAATTAFALMPHLAQAAWYDKLIGVFTGITPLLWGVGLMAWVISQIVSLFVGFAATLLNIGILLTTHLSLFIENNKVIFTVWGTMRDITSMVLIFFILYAAIKMILSVESPHFNTLLKNIIIMGILINFSFYIAQICIDASNIVSLQLYNAIAPQSANLTAADTQSIGTMIEKSIHAGGGGIAGILIEKIGATQQNKWIGSFFSHGASAAFDVKILTTMVFATVMSIFIQILTGISLIIAAVAAIWRTIVLIFLLGFSALWIAAYAIPQLEEARKMWSDHFRAQLVFLPVYLLLMYVALKIIVNSGFGDMVNGAILQEGQDPTISLIQIAVGSAIMIFMINVPFFAAVKFAGGSMAWTEKWYNSAKGKVINWSQRGVTSMYKGGIQGTYGRLASKVAENQSFKDLAARSAIGEYALKGTRGIASNYNSKLATQVKSRTEFAESLGPDTRAINQAEQRVRQLRANNASKQQIRDAEESLNRIRSGESRKMAYAERTNTRSIDTLFSKTARKDKLAAAKIQTPILEGRIKRHNEQMETIKTGLEQSQNQITSIESQIFDTEQKIAEIGRPNTPEQANVLNGLNRKLTSLNNSLTTQNQKLTTLQAEQTTLQGRQAEITRMENLVQQFRNMS